MEKFLFSKIEAWVLILLIILGIAGSVLFGGIVQHVERGGTKAGVLGEVANSIASIPDLLLAILRGEYEEDFKGTNRALSFSEDQYSVVGSIDYDGLENPPIYWANVQAGMMPIAMMMRLNDVERSEHLLIVDEQRNVIRNFPMTAGSRSGQFPPMTGNAAPVMLEDGSVIIFSGGSDGLYRKTLCGEIIWSIPGLFHHSVSVADGKLGILGLPKKNITSDDVGDRITRRWNHSEVINIIDVETGDILNSIKLEDVVRKNAGYVDPFMWRNWHAHVSEDGVLAEDMIHLNKVELLPESLAAQYPEFPAGSILISGRRQNVLAIIDPETLEILWFSHGYTQGQHDPEFIGNNKIIVFDNALDYNSDDPSSPLNFSSIKEFNFSDNQWRTLWNGANVSGFTGFAGEVDFTDEALLINLTEQGRYLEVSLAAELLSEFVNIGSDENVYWTKHAQYISDEQLEIAKSISCKVN